MKKALFVFGLIVLILSCEKNPVDNNKSTPPDEDRILFIRNVKNKLSQICTMKPDGSDIKVISQTEVNLYNIGYIHARWSPDKSKVVVVGGPESSPDIFPLWLMDMSGNFCRKIATDGFMPVWESNGEYIIFAHRRGYFSETFDTYRININTGEESVILWAETGTSGPNSGYIYQLLDIFPGEDNKILLNEYYTYRDTTSGEQIREDSELLIYDYLTEAKTYLTNNDLNEGWARISNDGNFIIYHLNDGLYLMDKFGENIEEVIANTNKKQQFLHLCWSPDGKKVLASILDSSIENNRFYDIYAIDLNTKALLNLTNTAKDSISNYVMDWK